MRTVDWVDVNELGLVAPPVTMMKRMTEEEMQEFEGESMHSEARRMSNLSIFMKADDWKMYQYSYKVANIFSLTKTPLLFPRTV